jgi:hypothetical protein
MPVSIATNASLRPQFISIARNAGLPSVVTYFPPTLAFFDTIGKTILDYATIYQSNLLVNAPTAQTILLGQVGASNSLVSRIAALTDLSTVQYLAPLATQTAQNIATVLNSSQLDLYHLYAPLLDAIDTAMGGLSSYLSSTSLQVSAAFGDAFNYAATHWQFCGLSGPMTPLLPANIFISANRTLGNILVTSTGFVTGQGSQAITLPGSGYYSIDSSRYTAASLLLVNARNATTTGSHFEFSIQYLDQSQNISTLAYTLTAAAPASAIYVLSISGYEIVNFTVQNADTINVGTPDQFQIIAQPPRTVTY